MYFKEYILVFKKISKEIVWSKDEWKYRSRITGEIYKVYEYKG